MRNAATALGRPLAWTAVLACAVVVGAAAAADEPAGKFEVHDVSLWIINAGGGTANQRDRFPSALPVTVASTRAAESSREERKSAPLGMITFHGDPVGELDVDLRIRTGAFLAHWPPCDNVPNHLRWVGKQPFGLVKDIGEASDLSFVDPDHWFNQARASDALYLKHGARVERFIAYDAELTKPGVPVKLEGGPDRYLVVNQLQSPLYDLLIVKHTSEGCRVAWLDELPAPSGLVVKSKTDGASDKDSKESAAEKVQDVEALFAEPKPAAAAEKPAAEKPPAQPPADAPQEVAAAAPASKPPVEKAPEMKLFGGLPKKVEAKLLEVQARAGQKPASKPSQGIEVTLSAPLPADSAEAGAATTAALTERLMKQGLTAAEAALFADRYAPLLFEDESMIVACRLPAVMLDEAVPLSVLPPPAKTVRVAMMLVRNADPQMDNEIEQLIAEMGHPSFAAREQAQQRLLDLGPVAFTALQTALSHSDPEIVIRAERILLRQHQTLTPKERKPAGGGNIQLPAVRINR